MSSRLLPPQSPCSEPDVASFAALVIHLRSQPELARENEKLLNAEALADLTEGVRQFQHAHLGRVSGNHVDGRAVHVSEQKHVLQFHATVRASPSLYEQWQQTSSFNISHISRPPSTALVSPSKSTIIAMIVLRRHKQHARAMQWPMVRIPDEIFRDRSRSGPLFTALLAAYREKNSSSWRTFDLPNPKR